MEHREAPRIAGGDQRFEGTLEDRGGRFQFRRFPFGRNSRQIHYGRALVVIIAGSSVLVTLAYLGLQARQAAFDWLHHQPQYQVSFQDIRLIPEPPPWYSGGKSVFLERVRQASREPENIAVLDVPSGQLYLDFKSFPWVRDVEHVSYAQQSITVRLRYRQPVAYVLFPPADRRLVDETGTILSVKDVDRVQLGPLIRIARVGIAPPTDSRVGVVWKWRRDGSDHDESDPRVLAAAKLAGFLRQPKQADDAEQTPALRMIEITLDSSDPWGLWLQNADKTFIWWDEAPGDEQPGRPSADQKWEMLRRWEESPNRAPVPDRDFLAFGNKEIELVCKHMDHPHTIKKGSD